MTREELDRLVAGLLRAFPGASDLNFTPGRRPQAEIDGELREIAGEGGVLTPASTAAMAEVLLGDSRAHREALAASGSCDLSWGLPSGTRLRVNVFLARGAKAIVLRVLPSGIPTLADLGLPAALEAIAGLNDGLVLVTGATGSGKSTTLAAVIGLINATRPVHIVTLEDPVEYAHPQRRATVNQRELGADFSTFAAGLRAALRQAPKVIMVGELRDAETIEIGLKASETGHLVLATLHTIDAGQAIGRLAGMFGPTEQRQVRSRLAEVLRLVVAQRLLPRAGGGRVAAVEIMGQSLRVRDLIREGEGSDATFRQAIAEGRSQGWQSFDQHIVGLFERGLVGTEAALAHASDRAEVARGLDRVRSSRGEETSSLGALEMEGGSGPQRQ
ncbi:MAG: type IV pilus twitching motility protein PilT [Candidatus Methylomirabilia bacterium]